MADRSLAVVLCRWLMATSCVALVVIATGCNRGPAMAPVKGTISINKKPVTQGTITFYPVAGGRPSSGQIQSDGSYALATRNPGDGALVGEHKVTIEARNVAKAPPEPTSFAEELASGNTAPAPSAQITWIVPQEFSVAETSGLTATVEAKSNVIDFNLP